MTKDSAPRPEDTIGVSCQAAMQLGAKTLTTKSLNGDGWIRISRPIFVPILLSFATAWLSATSTAWALIAIPFIVLGSLCAAPNLNLADVFLVLVSAALGVSCIAIY
jgi:hypothetical protein